VNQYIKTTVYIFLISSTLIAITACFAPTVLPIDPSNAEHKILKKQSRTFKGRSSELVLDAVEAVFLAYRKDPKIQREAESLTMVSSGFVTIVIFSSGYVEKWIIAVKQDDDATVATVAMSAESEVVGPYAGSTSTVPDKDTRIDYRTFWRGVENQLNGLPLPVCKRYKFQYRGDVFQSKGGFEPLCMPEGTTPLLTEQIINRLFSIPASRNEVIAVLGKPSRQMPASATKKDISYLACKTKKGFDLLDGDGPVNDYYMLKVEDCGYELIFEFDQTGQITGLRRIPFTDSRFLLPDGESMDSIRPRAESGSAPLQYLLYEKSGRHPDYAAWLCRSADNGYAKAQIDVGLMYWSATNIAQHRVKAYAWYKHAATGDINKDYAFNKRLQVRALQLMDDAEKSLSEEQLNEAGNIYTEWKQGACEIDFPNEAYMNRLFP